MKLRTYIEKNQIDRREFAREMGVDPVTVYRWETGRRFPRTHIRKIMALTKNKVTANDFLDVAGFLIE